MWTTVRGRRVYNGRLRWFGVKNKLDALKTLAKIRGMVKDKVEVGADEDLAALLTAARKRTKKTTETEIEELFK